MWWSPKPNVMYPPVAIRPLSLKHGSDDPKPLRAEPVVARRVRTSERLHCLVTALVGHDVPAHSVLAHLASSYMSGPRPRIATCQTHGHPWCPAIPGVAGHERFLEMGWFGSLTLGLPARLGWSHQNWNCLAPSGRWAADLTRRVRSGDGRRSQGCVTDPPSPPMSSVLAASLLSDVAVPMVPHLLTSTLALVMMKLGGQHYYQCPAVARAACMAELVCPASGAPHWCCQHLCIAARGAGELHEMHERDCHKQPTARRETASFCERLPSGHRKPCDHCDRACVGEGEPPARRRTGPG